MKLLLRHQNFLVISRLLLGVGIFCLVLSGCSSKVSPDEPKEISSASTPTMQGPEEDLFKTAKQYYADGLYSLAREGFTSLLANYPSGPYAEFAAIKIADSYFESGDYASAAKQFEDFAKGHPRSPSVPYALLRSAQALQASSRGAGRDASPLERALSQLDLLLQQFSTSSYAATAKTVRKEVLTTLSAADREIMNFYKKQGRQAAYEARKKDFYATWGTLLELEPETEDLTTGSPTLLAQNRQELSLLNPTSSSESSEPRISRAINSVVAPLIGLTNEPTGISQLEVVNVAQIKAASDVNHSHQAPRFVYGVNCATPLTSGSEGSGYQSGTIVLNLSREIEVATLASRVLSTNNTVSFAVPEGKGDGQVWECGAAKVSISQVGVVTIASFSANQALLMPMINPPRLAVIPLS